MKIDNIHLSHLRNDAHFQFHTEFKDLVIKCGAAALKIKPQFDAAARLQIVLDTHGKAAHKTLDEETSDVATVGIEELVQELQTSRNPKRGHRQIQKKTSSPRRAAGGAMKRNYMHSAIILRVFRLLEARLHNLKGNGEFL